VVVGLEHLGIGGRAEGGLGRDVDRVEDARQTLRERALEPLVDQVFDRLAAREALFQQSGGQFRDVHTQVAGRHTSRDELHRGRAFRREVQMVFQDPYGSLHPRQTVDRLLQEPLAIHGFADGEQRIQRALDEVGLGNGFRFRYAHQLSGGQRQRIAIARALVTDPRILIFDEATSALDYESERVIQQNMKDIAKGRTLLVIAHRLSTVRTADRIVTLDRGRLVEDGSHDSLIKTGGRYASLHRLQAGGFHEVG